jgi:hypothetical protein
VGGKPRIEIIRTKRDLADKLTAIIDAENMVKERERDLKRMLNKRAWYGDKDCPDPILFA